MTVCIERRSNNASETFIGLSSGAFNIVEIGVPAFYFVDPRIVLGVRECIRSILIPETGHNFDD
jgi:hypothetical protein